MKTLSLFLTRILFLASVFLVPWFAHAATLSAQTGSANVAVGSTVVITVAVNSGGVAINNAEGELVFPSSLFDLVSVNKATSLFSFWIEAPTFDGDQTVAFDGGLPSPGYQGSQGVLFTVTLRAKAAGVGTVTLVNGAVRANDGLGTDVLTGVNNRSLTVTKPATPSAPVTTETPSPSVPSTTILTLTSPTNPSEDAWYASSTAIFAWSIPEGVDAVQTLFGADKNATPAITYRPAISEKTVDTIDDGVWYFHARAHTSNGWGPSSVYKVQIDTTPPVFLPVALSYDDGSHSVQISTSGGAPAGSSFAGIATDARSGVQNVELLLDGQAVAAVPAEETGPVTVALPSSVSAGTHTLTLRAHDYAGNYTDFPPVTIHVSAPLAPVPSSIWSRIPPLSLDTILLILAILLFASSLLLNLFLWRRVGRRSARSLSASHLTRMHHTARQKLLALKADLHAQRAELTSAHDSHDLTMQEANSLRKTHDLLEEVETYLDKKIHDLDAS